MNSRVLYAITDSRLLAGHRLLPYVEAALAGGARWLQYRDKSGDALKRYKDAEQLKTLCSRYGARLIINDDVELAARLEVGVHLGQSDGSLRQARYQLGGEAWIGATCHGDLSLADRAVVEGASYLAFGRFFPSLTKPDAPTADIGVLSQAKRSWSLPLIAIGGITLDTASSLIDQGADGLAVIHALFDAPSASDVEWRARAFCRLFDNR